MKRSKRFFLFINFLIFMSSLLPLNVNAEHVDSEKGKTSVNIKVVQSPLHLSGVQAPKFGIYELTSKSQWIQPTSDLVINVQDKRTDTSSHWQINYELSFFENATSGQKASGTLKYIIGEGTLKIANQTVDNSIYQAQELELGQDQSGTLLKVNVSKKTDYEYRVSKQKIRILIPANSTVGEYKALQSIHLISLPEVE